MNPKEKILAAAFVLCIIVLVFFIIRKGIGYRAKSCQDAKQSCWDTFDTGTKTCQTVSDGNNTSFITCSIPVVIQLWSCWDNTYPPCLLSYALRNGSIFTVYFWRNDGTLIDYRDGWSPYKLQVKEEDFPITASTCDTFSGNVCNVDNGLAMIINDPGCYIVWSFGGLYTTDEICWGA